MLNIVIPMAGRGSRFANAGYVLPKPLIPVGDKSMIEVVINNLRPDCEHRFIFLCLADHVEQYEIDRFLQTVAPNCQVVPIKEVTQGAACTVLLAKSLINQQQPLIIANSDQWVDCNPNDFVQSLTTNSVDGLIMTMKASDPKWSYVRYDEEGSICEVVEKQVVSPDATVGIYGFRHGSDFVQAAERMIAKDLRVNGEFYVAPCYNELIDAGRQIQVFDVGSECNGMHGLGIPQDLERFMNTPSFLKTQGDSAGVKRRAA